MMRGHYSIAQHAQSCACRPHANQQACLSLPQLQALRACWGSLVRRSAPAVPASSASSMTRASAAVPATPTSSAAESWRRLNMALVVMEQPRHARTSLPMS